MRKNSWIPKELISAIETYHLVKANSASGGGFKESWIKTYIIEKMEQTNNGKCSFEIIPGVVHVYRKIGKSTRHRWFTTSNWKEGGKSTWI